MILSCSDLDGENGLVAVAPGNEVLSLDLSTAAWGEVHTEVWEALVPGAGNAHLLRAWLGVMASNRVQLVFCRCRSVELGRNRLHLQETHPRGS